MLQQQLEQLQNKLGTTRTAMGGIFSAKEKSQALQKQIKILENRLEKQFIKYNEVSADDARASSSKLAKLDVNGQVCQAQSTHHAGANLSQCGVQQCHV
jgi:hypothetical protein